MMPSRFNNLFLLLNQLGCLWILVGVGLADEPPYIPAQKHVALVEQTPQSVQQVTPTNQLVDFGKVAFGNLRLLPPTGAEGIITVHFGEKLRNGRIDRQPPGSVRYAAVTVELSGQSEIIVAPPADARNTEQVSTRHPPAVLTPAAWGVVLPFRWVEIEGWPEVLQIEHLHRRAAFSKAWDDEAASFNCSDETLNDIWELCRYTMKATTFAGVFVDGDRERIPYEADTHVAQLSHYATDNDPELTRRTFDWLMKYGTWPTECAYHMVFIAHADWLHTGDAAWLEPRFAALQAKLLPERLEEDGLIHSTPKQRGKDLVDWPGGERDGYVFTEINTVVNAFHLSALQRMAVLARAIDHVAEAERLESQFEISLQSFNALLFDIDQGRYVDGVGTTHTSLHANLFPLAFGLVAEVHRPELLAWMEEQGMRCSIFVAQFLLEGLFEAGAEKYAVELMTADTNRSWRHMLASGTTLTWEAWDQTFKPNQDWNHAWGTAPANLLPRYILGARPLTPGWTSTLIRPALANLKFARGKIPTPLGAIGVEWKTGDEFELELFLPEGISALVELPVEAGEFEVLVNDQSAAAERVGASLRLSAPVHNHARLRVRSK